ncbi:MAG TPA: ABC transporter permease subunit [Clostridiales bacterium]|nr:ABC transporter permease subunit [Clostridiales bacterium]
MPILRFFGQMMNMKWVGLKWFENIFAKPDFWQAFRNTLFISFGRIVFEFPIPILLALLMNEMYHQRLKRVYQTVYTFPHFLSWVLVASLMNTLFLSDGTVNAIIKSLGGQPVRFLTDPVIFRPMLFITSIWKSAGWSSIIYMATISGIDSSLYEHVAAGQLYLWPKAIDLTNYKIIFSDARLMRSIGVSAFNTVFGTIMAMIVTTMAGYAFSKKSLPGRSWLMTMFIITMYFGGGLIPWYLVLKDLGFIDSIFVMTVPGLLSTYNMILMRNYFGTIPESLPESARIDGAHEFRILIQIIIPLAAPIIATISLFYAVGFWNEWWNAMLFLAKRDDLYPLQLLLRKIVIESTLDLGNEMANEFKNANINVYGVGMQMASVTVATIPIMCVYPFVQKYFASGIMLGAVKS